MNRVDTITWAPRIFGLGLCAFLGVMSLDSWGQGHDVMETTVAMTMGLIPALIILVTVIVAWKHELIGAVVFAALAIFYIATSMGHPSWILVIGGPLVIGAALYFIGWRHRTHAKLASSGKAS